MTTLDRPKIVAHISRSRIQRSYPRFQMTLIVTATGLAGFLASFLLLHLGLDQMWLRYPLAAAFAYGVFFLLLRIWITYQQRGISIAEDALDLADLNPTDFLPPNRSAAAIRHSDNSYSWSDLIPKLDGDEWLAIIVFLVAILTALIASIFIVFSAPTLLGEVLLDAVIMAGLRRKLIRVTDQHWTVAALRRTVVPFIAVALVFSLAGGIIQQIRPGAKSIGAIFHTERVQH